MNIKEYKISVNNSDLFYFSPEGEHTIFGGLAVLKENKFRWHEVPFCHNDIVIDLGSNVGIFSITLAKMMPEIKLLSFDMNPVANHCLKLGIIKNGLLNVTPFDFGLSDKTVEMKCYSDKYNPTCSIQQDLCIDGSHPNGYESRLVNISEIFDSPILNIKTVKYLKMDIEGGEFAIFDYLFNKRPDILDKIQYLHLEIHKMVGSDFHGLEKRVKEKFENRLFLDC